MFHKKTVCVLLVACWLGACGGAVDVAGDAAPVGNQPTESHGGPGARHSKPDALELGAAGQGGSDAQ